MHYQFNISVLSFALIVPEVCQVVFDESVRKAVRKAKTLHDKINEVQDIETNVQEVKIEKREGIQGIDDLIQ